MPVRALPAVPQRLALRFGRWPRRFAWIVCIHLLQWHELARQRRALLALSDHMLKDIGISRAEAEREARRTFWSERMDRRSDREC